MIKWETVNTFTINATTPRLGWVFSFIQWANSFMFISLLCMNSSAWTPETGESRQGYIVTKPAFAQDHKPIHRKVHDAEPSELVHFQFYYQTANPFTEKCTTPSQVNRFGCLFSVYVCTLLFRCTLVHIRTLYIRTLLFRCTLLFRRTLVYVCTLVFRCTIARYMEVNLSVIWCLIIRHSVHLYSVLVF